MQYVQRKSTFISGYNLKITLGIFINNINNSLLSFLKAVCL